MAIQKSTPEVFYVRVTSFEATIVVNITVQIKDCSLAQIALAGEAALGPIVRDIAKNNGQQILFNPATLSTWFIIDDPRPVCGITGYLLYD